MIESPIGHHRGVLAIRADGSYGNHRCGGLAIVGQSWGAATAAAPRVAQWWVWAATDCSATFQEGGELFLGGSDPLGGGRGQ